LRPRILLLPSLSNLTVRRCPYAFLRESFEDYRRTALPLGFLSERLDNRFQLFDLLFLADSLGLCLFSLRLLSLDKLEDYLAERRDLISYTLLGLSLPLELARRRENSRCLR
jgi:hypothetical protein